MIEYDIRLRQGFSVWVMRVAILLAKYPLNKMGFRHYTTYLNFLVGFLF